MNYKLFLKITPTLLAACLALSATPAIAGSGAVIRDCSLDGTLNGHYTQGELQGALHNLPSDLDEYSDCRSVIRAAALSKAGGDKGSNPSAAATKVDKNAPASAGEQGKVASATKSGAAVKIGGKEVKPGDPGFLAAEFNNDVPTLLLAVLALFAAATLAGAAFAAKRRWPDQADAVAKPFKAIGRGIKGGTSRFRR